MDKQLLKDINNVINEKDELDEKIVPAGNTKQNWNVSLPAAKERAEAQTQERRKKERREKVLSDDERKKIVDKRMAERRQASDKEGGTKKKEDIYHEINNIVNTIDKNKSGKKNDLKDRIKSKMSEDVASRTQNYRPEDLKTLSNTSTGENKKRRSQTPEMKKEAERMLDIVKQKFSKLIAQGNYNQVISTLKRLTEENENNNANKTK
jgi:hypothetical protein